ncbi:MAG: general stress protein [Clostridiales bacterium]|jgi:uncharacterized membrane protein|nr:general stress protein [Clostridiales bacterium]
MKVKKLIGVFDHESNAYRAIERLIKSGFEADEISVLYKYEEDVEKIAKNTEVNIKSEDAISATEAGVVTGGLVGGFGGLMAQLGLVAVPGVGPLLATGPIAVTLAGLVTGGALGGLIGSIMNLGFSKEEAEEFERYLEQGKIIIFVDDKDETVRKNVHHNFYENESLIRERYKIEEAKAKTEYDQHLK